MVRIGCAEELVMRRMSPTRCALFDLFALIYEWLKLITCIQNNVFEYMHRLMGTWMKVIAKC